MTRRPSSAIKTEGVPSRSGGPTDIDENGVDRAQIRAFLELDPEERLRRIEAFLESAFEIQERNEASQVR